MNKILIVCVFVLVLLVSCKAEEVGKIRVEPVELPPPPSYVGLENSVVFEVEKVSFVPNKEVEMQIKLRKYPDVEPASFQFDIFYDPKTVEIINVLADDVVSKAEKEVQTSRLGDRIVRVIVAGINSNVIQEGKALRLKLKPLTTNPDFKLIKSIVSSTKAEIIDSSIKN